MGLGSNPTSAPFLYWYLEHKRRFLLVIFKNIEISEARRRRAGILVYSKLQKKSPNEKNVYIHTQYMLKPASSIKGNINMKTLCVHKYYN